jgi:4-amino-4-deoxy-L-arabinose transferase-like glycosyltransferase
VAWMWFGLLLLFFSLAPPKVARYVLPLVPAGALLAAQVWRGQIGAAERGERPRRVWVLVHSHWVLFTLASLVMGVLLMSHRMLAEWAWIEPMELRVLSAPVGVALMALLLGLAAAGWREHHKWRPMPAAVLTIVWCVVVTTVYWHVRHDPALRGDAPVSLEAPP